MRIAIRGIVLTAAMPGLLATFNPALAQQLAAAATEGIPSSGGLEEIIVTARKRQESSLAVPAAISTITGQELSREGIHGLDQISQKIPGFMVGEGGGTVQGGTIVLRGISAADSNPLGEQAVSFNFDGVQVARASVRRLGEFDMAQIDVLKGPQALFYGKNSPGGIVVMTTADPTDELQAGGNAGYEFNAKEFRGEGYVSGPLARGLGGRLAVYGSNMGGWVTNTLPASDPFAPSDRTSPDASEVAVRGTLKYNNDNGFRARLKLTYNVVHDGSSAANYQNIDCPSPRQPYDAADDCTADDRISQGVLGSGFAAAIPHQNLGGILDVAQFGDGTPKSTSRQWLSGLELNYDLSKELTATAVTGFYKYDFFNRADFTGTSYPAAILGSVNALAIREINEEVRLQSNFEGRINFMVGAQYQNSKAQTASVAAFGAIPGQLSILGRPSPFVASSYYLDQGGNAYSAFAQLQLKILPVLELSAGGRYSEEAKTLPSVFNRGVQLVGTSPFLSNGNERKSFNNFSPEVSLSYRPNDALNVYGTYKQGFLSGGFNGGSFNAAGDLGYKPEKVKGWEAGVKGRFFDDTLNVDLALYTYGISNLQVQVTTNGTVQELKNAGQVSSKGVELGLAYRPIRALSLYGNVAYAKGTYDSYYATCYTGEAVLAPGTGIGHCAIQPNPTNGNVVGLLQNLSGTELVRAPKWTGNAGFTYDTAVSSTLVMGFTGGATYSGSYIVNPNSQPRARQASYTLLDASVRLGQIDDKWAFSFIGRNLSNKFYVVRGTDNPAGVVLPTQLAATFGVVSRGREFWLRSEVKF